MTREENSIVVTRENSGSMIFGQINDIPNTITGLDIPVVKLTTGLYVANFSTPHSFSFVDGSILPACSMERAVHLVLDKQKIEIETCNPINKIRFTDVLFRWEMSLFVRKELSHLSKVDGYDILLIPYSIMTDIKEIGLPIGRCRLAYKVGKDSRVNHIDRFYI